MEFAYVLCGMLVVAGTAMLTLFVARRMIDRDMAATDRAMTDLSRTLTVFENMHGRLALRVESLEKRRETLRKGMTS